jgi:hypothetical protein
MINWKENQGVCVSINAQTKLTDKGNQHIIISESREIANPVPL